MRTLFNPTAPVQSSLSVEAMLTTIPQSVLRDVRDCLDALADYRHQVAIGRDADRRFGGAGRYLEDTRRNLRARLLSTSRQLRDFCAAAREEGCDPIAILKTLSGKPTPPPIVKPIGGGAPVEVETLTPTVAIEPPAILPDPPVRVFLEPVVTVEPAAALGVGLASFVVSVREPIGGSDVLTLATRPGPSTGLLEDGLRVAVAELIADRAYPGAVGAAPCDEPAELDPPSGVFEGTSVAVVENPAPRGDSYRYTVEKRVDGRVVEAMGFDSVDDADCYARYYIADDGDESDPDRPQTDWPGELTLAEFVEMEALRFDGGLEAHALIATELRRLAQRIRFCDSRTVGEFQAREELQERWLREREAYGF